MPFPRTARRISSARPVSPCARKNSDMTSSIGASVSRSTLIRTQSAKGSHTGIALFETAIFATFKTGCSDKNVQREEPQQRSFAGPASPTMSAWVLELRYSSRGTRRSRTVARRGCAPNPGRAAVAALSPTRPPLSLAFNCLRRFVAARRNSQFRDPEEQIGLNVAFSYRDGRLRSALRVLTDYRKTRIDRRNPRTVKAL